MDSTEIALKTLKLHEKYKRHPYRCTAGKLTVGYGRNLDDMGLTEPESEMLLKDDVAYAFMQLEDDLPFFNNLSEVRKAVLLDMAVNLGLTRFYQFKKFFESLQKEEYANAGFHMLDSKWAKQVGDQPGQRAHRLYNMMIKDELIL